MRSVVLVGAMGLLACGPSVFVDPDDDTTTGATSANEPSTSGRDSVDGSAATLPMTVTTTISDADVTTSVDPDDSDDDDECPGDDGPKLDIGPPPIDCYPEWPAPTGPSCGLPMLCDQVTVTIADDELVGFGDSDAVICFLTALRDREEGRLAVSISDENDELFDVIEMIDPPRGMVERTGFVLHTRPVRATARPVAFFDACLNAATDAERWPCVRDWIEVCHDTTLACDEPCP